MAITIGAKKAHRASLRKNVYNQRRKVAMRAALKKIKTLIQSGKKDEAMSLVPETYKIIDKAAKRGVIKPNTASRKKSKLMKLLRETVS